MAGVASSNRQRNGIAPVFDDPARAGLSGHLLCHSVRLVVPHLAVDDGRFDLYPPKLTFAWEWSNYARALSEYRDQILRSFGCALAATILCLLLAFPLAYVIAFKAGRFKNLLGLVILPFFVTFSSAPSPGRRSPPTTAGWSARWVRSAAAARGTVAVDQLGGDRRPDLQLDHLR